MEDLVELIQTKWDKIKHDVLSIWDAGEILLGYGEFLKNNKSLVPADIEWIDGLQN